MMSGFALLLTAFAMITLRDEIDKLKKRVKQLEEE